MLNLVMIVFIFVFVCSALTGLVGFIIDIRRFKNQIEFSGSRKRMLERLMDEKELEKQKESEVTANENKHND